MKQEGTNIASQSAKVKLVSEIEATKGKVLEKKLLMSMTVSSVKAMCAKFFKVEVIRSKLIYKEEASETLYDLDEDLRQLSFYSIRDGGHIIVQEK